MDRMESPQAPAPKTPEQLAVEAAARKAAYYGIRPNVTKKAVPDPFKDDANPMTITYRTMGATALQEFYDRFPSLQGAALGEAAKWLADRYLLAWESYTTLDGDLVPFKESKDEAGNRVIDDGAWDCVSRPLRSLILEIILSDNHPTPREATGVKS